MSTRNKIALLAEELIHRNGYLGFSYADISQALHIKNAAIHYHFSTKEDLGIEIIKNATTRFLHWQNHMDNAGLEDWTKLDKYFTIYDVNSNTQNRMCLVTSLCSDYNQLPEKVKLALDEFVKLVFMWFSTTLETGRENGSFHFDGSAQDRAAIIQTSLMGALLINRTMESNQYEKVKNQLIKDIK